MNNGKSSILDKDLFWLLLMAALTVIFCQRLLFTDQIIRASDVITQFYWGAKGVSEQTLFQYLRSIPDIFRASWEPLNDGGRTLEGGWNAIGLLFHRYLIQHYFPFPSSIAWLAVLSLLWGGIGTFFYCRLIGVSRFGAFAAGTLFALCTENASLINAGHIQKIETISWFPWVLLFLEKSLRGGRLFHYAMTACLLGIQFFNMHWQISFYTCLAVGGYWFFHVSRGLLAQGRGYFPAFRRDFLLASVMTILFFTTIAMSFAPLFSWSEQSERSGGMTAGEGMSWSMPPEEILTFFIPGLLGFSRQEAGDVPAKGQVYYWGRMRFTQTADYLGLLPWLMIPLPLLFRRDRHTWFFTALMAATLVMALGKYTPFYRFLFDHAPGFSTFRVPKMVLFLFAFGASVLMGRGLDVLADGAIDRKRLEKWLFGCAAFAGLMALLLLFLSFGGKAVLFLADGVIDQATRYQRDPSLIMERYLNMPRETSLALAILCAHLALFLAWFRRRLPTRYLLPVLALFLLLDLWRVNDRFFVLTAPPPVDGKAARNDIVRFLAPRIGQYRMQPLTSENAHYYADYGLPNISAYVTISERRYREFLDCFSLDGGMPDMMNLKYLVVQPEAYKARKDPFSARYEPVFTATSGALVLENRTVLPKAWLVPSVAVVPEPGKRLAIMNASPDFRPALVALVETQPPLAMAPYVRQDKGVGPATGSATVTRYEPNRIDVETSAERNALLVLGEKYYRWWYAYVDGKNTDIHPVNHILRGVYLTPGAHKVEFVFDPLPFKIGKWLTLASFAFFAFMLGREAWSRRVKGEK